jgi:hypothetical protein
VLKKKAILVDDDDDDDADDDDNGYESNMISECTQGDLTSSADSIVEEDVKIFVDSCASKDLLIITNANILDNVETVAGRINLTGKAQFMNTQGIGTKNTWRGITACKDSVKNICAVGRLKTAGYGLSQLEEDWIVDLSSGQKLLKCRHLNGMPYVLIDELFDLEDKSNPA